VSLPHACKKSVLVGVVWCGSRRCENQLKCGCSWAELKMAKRPLEEYEDVSEIVTPRFTVLSVLCPFALLHTEVVTFVCTFAF